jgi:hypothetical protein
MSSFLDYLFLQTNPASAEALVAQAKRRTKFCELNAALALKGFTVDAEELARQESIIIGRITHEEAEAQMLAEENNKRPPTSHWVRVKDERH